MPTFTVFKGAADGKPKKSTTTKPDELTHDQVLLKVTASGLCGTDLHSQHRDIVLGHEGVGIVEEIGPDVKYIRKGDRVGWGYQTDACEHCIQCLQGDEIYCPNRKTFSKANFDQGSFASHAIWREAFLHQIPTKLKDEEAAPLQCGGATVFTALQNLDTNETVGIIGVGGLGHLAIQFAAKLGCRVVVISGSERKRADAERLGAHKFVAMTAGDVEKQMGDWRLTRLLVTTSAQPDWETLLPLMESKSQIIPLSVSKGNLVVPYPPLISKGISIRGSLVASRAVHRKMLEFAALHNIKPIIETFPMTEDGIARAMEKLEAGNIHYRAVLLPP